MDWQRERGRASDGWPANACNVIFVIFCRVFMFSHVQLAIGHCVGVLGFLSGFWCLFQVCDTDAVHGWLVHVQETLWSLVHP